MPSFTSTRSFALPVFHLQNVTYSFKYINTEKNSFFARDRLTFFWFITAINFQLHTYFIYCLVIFWYVQYTILVPSHWIFQNPNATSLIINDTSQNNFYWTSMFLKLNNLQHVWQTYWPTSTKPLTGFLLVNERIQKSQSENFLLSWSSSISNYLCSWQTFSQNSTRFCLPYHRRQGSCLNDIMWPVQRSPLCNTLNKFFIYKQMYEYIYLFMFLLMGDRCSTVVKVLRYKSEGRWFDPS